MKWALLGGPDHGKIGEGVVPAGYVTVGAGKDMPRHFPRERREADTVYRWHEDAAYISDGQQILKNWQDGNYAVPSHIAPIAQAGAGLGLSALNEGIGIIANNPDMDEADRWRKQIDIYRDAGLV